MININGAIWRIIYVYPYSPILMNSDGKYSLAATVNKSKTIFISNEINEEKLKHVLSHELLHAEIMSRRIIIPDDVEETLCNIVANNFTEIVEMINSIRNNLNSIL